MVPRDEVGVLRTGFGGVVLDGFSTKVVSVVLEFDIMVRKIHQT